MDIRAKMALGACSEDMSKRKIHNASFDLCYESLVNAEMFSSLIIIMDTFVAMEVIVPRQVVSGEKPGLPL